MKTNRILVAMTLLAATLVSCENNETLPDNDLLCANSTSDITPRSTTQPAGIYNAGDLMNFVTAWNTAQKTGDAAAMASVLAHWSSNGMVGLYADIDMTGVTCPPILNFTGSFTGRGYTIRHLTINAGTDAGGLFNKLQGSAMVTDLILDSCSISGLYAGGIAGVSNGTIRRCTFRNGSITSPTSYAGGIVGNHTSGPIQDCVVEGTTTVKGDTSGGIVGQNDATISGCSVNSISISGASRAGGIAGVILADGNIDGCKLNGGNVTGTSQGAGGIASANSGKISACLVTGNCSINSSLAVGGIVGVNGGGVIWGCVSAPGTVKSRTTVKGIVAGSDPYNGIFSCYWAPTNDTKVAIGAGYMIGGGQFNKAAIGNFFTTGNPTPITDMNNALTKAGSEWKWQAGATGQLPVLMMK